MLIYLADYLTRFHSGFNVFSYLTLRAILGALTALALSFAMGPYVIQRLSARRVGQPIRSLVEWAMGRNNEPGDLSRKLLNRSSTGPSRVSALAVRCQRSLSLPLT